MMRNPLVILLDKAMSASRIKKVSVPHIHIKRLPDES